MSSTASYLVGGNRSLRSYPEWAARSLQNVFPRMLGERLTHQRWVRYWVDLEKVPPAPAHVRLQPVTEAMMAELRGHEDSAHNQLRSGFRFWDLGLRRAYLWASDGVPVCIQWLLLADDRDALRRLPQWAGMYPPLSADTGQVENLYRFSTAGLRRNVAVEYELAMYQEARRLGLRYLITHIHADNRAAQRFAQRAAWLAAGSIWRYTCELPGLRNRPFYVHEQALPEGAAAPAPVASAA